MITSLSFVIPASAGTQRRIAIQSNAAGFPLSQERPCLMGGQPC